MNQEHNQINGEGSVVEAVETVAAVPVVEAEKVEKVKGMPKAQLAGLMSLFGGSKSYKNWLEASCLPDEGVDLSFDLVQSIVKKEKLGLRLYVGEERTFFLYLLFNVLMQKEIKLLDWLDVQDAQSDGVTEDDLKSLIKLAEFYKPEQLDNVLLVGMNRLERDNSVITILLAFGKKKNLFHTMEQWAQDMVLDAFRDETESGLEAELAPVSE